jgi:hypothetical protein
MSPYFFHIVSGWATSRPAPPKISWRWLKVSGPEIRFPGFNDRAPGRSGASGLDGQILLL